VTKYEGEVYNIETSDNTYCTPAIVHNSQTRDFISVNDVVNAIILAAEMVYKPNNSFMKKKQSIFNIGSGKPTRITDLAQLMLNIFGLNSTIHPIHSDPVAGDIMHSIADIRRSKSMLKFNVTEDLKEGLTTMINSSCIAKK
jgi:nucleoside-diphosphate-sugar epimerase